ncbi:NAD(P)/FAD-dependent oxidoreductase [Cognatishimia sp.]|uniref:NAD(P)/FAD-dependent oxidoreductase n=1 Tax=Cognatishimia sp. TaxID=2211648 RepID=UPI003519CAEE
MSFDIPTSLRQRVAIVGGGISGMAAAYQLADQFQVTLYEGEKRLGGHARTVVAGLNGDQPVDTGFIVFNYVNYPHLTRMFQDLDVPVEKSDMSFGATIDGGRIEYGLRNLSSLTAQKENLTRPSYYRMVRDIFKFNANAEALAKTDDVTIGDLIKTMRLGDWFRRYYLMPICGAIWSTPATEIDAFPAKSLVQFFRNHALLSHKGQHQWWTVSGGSTSYVGRLRRNLELRGVEIRENAPVEAVRRTQSGAVVSSRGHEAESYDQVVMACHSDDSLRLLTDASPEERAALGDLRYQDNRMILHRDTAQMPKRRACWSSWVYKADLVDSRPEIGVTYWMNKLQNIPENDPMFVSLNPATDVRDELIYDQKMFRHPIFDSAALRAQQTVAQLQGTRNTWFAGAYLRHGFHEDGYASAMRVTRSISAQRLALAA